MENRQREKANVTPAQLGIIIALVFIIGYRFDYLKRKHWEKEKRCLLYTNLALLALAVVMSYLIGFTNYVIIQLPITFIATGLVSWFFYVQHNYEDSYWDEGET